MPKYQQLKSILIEEAKSFGFQQARITDTNTEAYFEAFDLWVKDGFNGDMEYLQTNHSLRKNPEQLHPNTQRIISLRYDYLSKDTQFVDVLQNQNLANISRYAVGRDYHKLLRKKLSKLCQKLEAICNDFQIEDIDYRVFVDSAPILETCFAEKSGVGWKGKHTLVINKDAGSLFFLAEIFINIPLPIDNPVENNCKDCTACINICPTGAIIEPYKIDATRCISYLTIENKGAIPLEFREKIGNRIYGCDDCQLVCPWNRYASNNVDNDFMARNNLNSSSMLSLFSWTESEFLTRLQGSPIRRIGYQNWLRNLAVGIGNSPASKANIQALDEKRGDANEMVVEHFEWAIDLQKKHLKNDTRDHNKNSKLQRTVKKLMPNFA